MMHKSLKLTAFLIVIAGCATAPPPVPPPAPAPAAIPEPSRPQATPRTPVLKKETIAYLARRGHKPITGQPLNVAVNCSFRDEDGYAGRLDLTVSNARVERFDARIDVPRRGACQFRLAEFRQTESLPIVVLVSQRSPCKVSLWEQDRQITVAFRDCRSKCEGHAVDYLWPILVDGQKKTCS